MGLFDFLGGIFGGEKSQSQQQQTQTSQSQGTSTSQASSLPSNINPFTALFGGNLQNLVGSLGGGVAFPQYTGPTAPTMSGAQTGLLSLLGGLGAGSGQGSQDYLSQLLSGGFLPGQGGANPFLDAAITAAQRPTMQNLTQTLTQDLPSRFTQAGQFIQPNTQGQGGSSAFDTAAALATRGAAQAMSDIATNMSMGAYNTERQLQQQGVQLAQGEVQTTISNLQAQALPMLIQQFGIQNGIQLFQTGISQILQFLQTLGGISGPTPVQTSQSTSAAQQTAGSYGQGTGTATSQKINNPFASLFGGATGMSGLGNLINIMAA